MSDEAIDTFNVDGLEQLLKALHVRPPVARVGILGGKDTRQAPERAGWVSKEIESAPPTNSEIGAAHEFGSPARGLPQRSFLRMPIGNNLQKELERSGLLTQEVFDEVIKTGTVIPWMKKVAICAEACVSDAFDNGGPGWPAWKSSSYSNNAGQLLVDTKQLRESITSEVGS